MDKWNGDARTLFKWARLVWLRSQKKVSIHLSLSPSCLTINFIEPRLSANDHHPHHHLPMMATTHHHNGHECPPMDDNERPPSTTWITTGNACLRTTRWQSRTSSEHIAELMQHWTRLHQKRGGSTWQEVGGWWMWRMASFMLQQLSPLLTTPCSDKWWWQMFIDNNRPQPWGTRDEHKAKTMIMDDHAHDHGKWHTTMMPGPLPWMRMHHQLWPQHMTKTMNDEDAQWTMVTTTSWENIYISRYFITPFLPSFCLCIVW